MLTLLLFWLCHSRRRSILDMLMYSTRFYTCYTTLVILLKRFPPRKVQKHPLLKATRNLSGFSNSRFSDSFAKMDIEEKLQNSFGNSKCRQAFDSTSMNTLTRPIDFESSPSKPGVFCMKQHDYSILYCTKHLGVFSSF